MEDYQWYKQHFAQRRVVPERNINFPQLQQFRFKGLFTRMSWLSAIIVSKPVFSTLVRAFYSRVTYGIGGPITFIVRGVEICLDPKSICFIFYIASVGLRVYESKLWSTTPRFEPREAIKMICGILDAHGMGKPSAHNLMVISIVLHHMLCFIFFPMRWTLR